ncbi:hypothetical protein AB0L00_29005 [Actinoallomurus sp. NPDC052308]|uniref:hypothetical protein n=1 Tax=Actinoallomurus sp. NPDC052308 TaxID=3155530 RepID=UPI0034131A31
MKNQTKENAKQATGAAANAATTISVYRSTGDAGAAVVLGAAAGITTKKVIERVDTAVQERRNNR